MGIINKSLNIFLIFLILFILFNCNRNQKNKNEKLNQQTQEDNSSIDVFGIMKTTVIENINIDFPAKIEKFYIKEGERVKLGDILLSLSIEDYEASIRSKRIELETARYELKISLLEYEKLNDALKHASEELIKEEEYYNTKKTMFENGNIAKIDLDEAESLFKTREKEVNEIKLSLEKYVDNNNTIEIQKNKIISLEIDLNRYLSKLNMKNLKNNSIVSNVRNGIVYEISYSNGDYIIPTNQNYNKILSIMDLDSMVVQADVPEEFVKDIKIGTEAIISPTADLNRKYKGKISRISSMAIKKNNETIILVDINLDKVDDFLRPNFNVDVKIFIDKNDLSAN